MKQINFDNFKCRCSAINKILANSSSNPILTEKQAIELQELEKKDILTEKQGEKLAELLIKRENSSKVILSDTAIDYLMEWYAWEVERKLPVEREAMELDALTKGKKQEDESIMLLSKLDQVWYQKNDIRVENEYLSGEPDIFLGEDIYKATAVKDNKAIWDLPVFLRQINKPLQPIYRQQIQGYGDITTAPDLAIVKTLVDMPEETIFKYKERYAQRMGVIDQDTPSFQREWQKWEDSMRFDSIPIHKRVYKIKVEPFTATEQKFLYDRVKICREWLWIFHETYSQLNIKTA